MTEWENVHESAPCNPSSTSAASRMCAGSRSSAGCSTTSSAPTASTGTSRARSISAARAATEANADFAGIRERVKKMADIGPAFEAVARRREAKAKAAEEADSKVTARDNYFMAAVHWGAAQWPYDQNDEPNIAYNNKKRECYTKYAALADHQRRAGLGAVPRQGDPGLVPPAAGLQGRPHSGGDRDPRHGQLQGNPGRALRRPLPQPRHGGAGDRRARPIRGADARHLFLGGELDRGRQGRWSTGSPAGPRSTPSASAAPARASAPSSAPSSPRTSRASAPLRRCRCATSRAATPSSRRRRRPSRSGSCTCPASPTRTSSTRSARPSPGKATPTRSACPTWCVAGECEELSPIEHSERLVEDASRARSRWWSIRNRAIRSATCRPPISDRSRRSWSPTGWRTALAGKPFPSEHWFVRSNGQIDKMPY